MLKLAVILALAAFSESKSVYMPIKSGGQYVSKRPPSYIHKELDIEFFVGKWHEIGSVTKERSSCYQFVYELGKKEGTRSLSVKKTCLFLNKNSKGQFAPDKITYEGLFKKARDNFQLSFSDFEYNNVNIVLVSNDKSYFVATNNLKTNLTILSKSESLSNQSVCGILEELRIKGFKVSNILLTKNHCPFY